MLTRDIPWETSNFNLKYILTLPKHQQCLWNRCWNIKRADKRHSLKNLKHHPQVYIDHTKTSTVPLNCVKELTTLKCQAWQWATFLERSLGPAIGFLALGDFAYVFFFLFGLPRGKFSHTMFYVIFEQKVSASHNSPFHPEPTCCRLSVPRKKLTLMAAGPVWRTWIDFTDSEEHRQTPQAARPVRRTAG